jgi:integration host factor subunit beta
MRSIELTSKERDLLKSAVALVNEKLVEDGDRIILRGFGTFSLKLHPERVRKNPRTGADVECPARMALKFKPSKGD